MTRLLLKIINLTMVQYTLDTLNATQDKILRTQSKSSNTEEARKFGKMDRNMKVNFSNGKPNGKGVFNSPNGDTYEGSFKDSLANGFGNFTQKDGTIFAGEWK